MRQMRVNEDEIDYWSQQLEVRSYMDEAWYNATVEILDDRIHIRFEGFGEEEDEIWDFNYLRKHAGNIGGIIRLASPQLQDQDCGCVVEDMVVCARHVQDTDLSDEDEIDEEVKYFDAMITRVDRSLHDFFLGEESCNCVFEAYWISGPDKKKHRRFYNNVLFSCGDICLLNPRDVEMHPVVKRILRLLDSRVLRRPLQQPMKDLLKLKSEKAKFKVSGTKRMGGQRACSPVSSQEIELDSDCIISGSIINRESSSGGEDREVCVWEMPQQMQECDIAYISDEAEVDEDSRSMETVASEDLSSSTAPTVTKKRSKLVRPKQKYKQLTSLKVAKKAKKTRSQADSSKPSRKKMRGSITKLLGPPVWFKPGRGRCFTK